MVIFGKSYEVLWIDKEGETRFTQYSPLEAHVETDSKGNIICAFKPYTEEDINGNKEEFAEVYDSDGIRYFQKVGSQYVELENKFKPHYFEEIPVIVHNNNDEQMGDFERFIKLIDGVNKLLSDNQNEIEAFANAFLSITNAEGTKDEDIARMKQQGVLLLPKDAKAEWLIKNINNQYQLDHFKTLDDLIHDHSATPKLTSEQFASNLSGTAIKTKLQGLINKTATRERKLGKSLRKRVRLITKILNKEGSDYDPYTIRFQFNRNIPSNENDITDQITKLQSLVDIETLLSWHPKIENASQVIEKKKEEEPSVNLERMFDNEDEEEKYKMLNEAIERLQQEGNNNG
jgi:SPP1 family phage portal protein